MTELDLVWSKMLNDALPGANADVADYLRLKASNDAIRSAGVGWLFETLIEIGGRRTGERLNIVIEHLEPHSFAHGSSNMVGRLVSFRLGVRCLTVEAGWARTPSDGIMRQGSIAIARFSHFGRPKHLSTLRFVHRDALPAWIDEDGNAADRALLERQFAILLED